MTIKLASTQAEQLSLHFWWKVENKLCRSFMRILFKGALLIEIARREKRKKESNLGLLDPLSDLLPLELPSRIRLDETLELKKLSFSGKFL